MSRRFERIQPAGSLYYLSFISVLESNGIEWLYSGNGVRLGEGAREIFRYQMPDSSWRVIYGDLHSEELPAENAQR